VLGDQESSTNKKTSQAKITKQSIWHFNSKHEIGMDRRQCQGSVCAINGKKCSLFFFIMEIFCSVGVQERQKRTPTAVQHKVFLRSLVDPDI